MACIYYHCDLWEYPSLHSISGAFDVLPEFWEALPVGKLGK